MQITVRSYLPCGYYDGHSFNLSADKDVTHLQELVNQKFKIPMTKQILKYKRDGLTLKLIPGWPLCHYGITNNDVIYLEKIPSQDGACVDTEDSSTRQNYFMKLGIFIREGEDQDLWRKTWIMSNDKCARVLTLRDNGSLLSNDSEEFTKENQVYSKSSISSKGEDNVEVLIKEVKANNIGKVMKLLVGISNYCKSACKPSTNEDPAEKKARIIINQKNRIGWSAFHWSVFLNYIDLSSELLNLGADVNSQTDDGWTPLQLAIYKNHIEMFQGIKLLLRQPDLRINNLTKKGTALHVAATNGRAESVLLLCEHGADFTIKTKEGQTAYELVTNEKTRKVFEALLFRTRVEAYNCVKTKEPEPSKPIIVKGWAFKKKDRFPSFKKKFVVLNAAQGTLIYYKTEEDYPDRPSKIITLKEVYTVRRKKAELLFDKSFNYLQLNCGKGKKYIFGFYNEDIVSKWVFFIQRSLEYTLYLEERIKTTSGDYSLINSLMVAEETLEEVVIEDRKSTEHTSRPHSKLQGLKEIKNVDNKSQSENLVDKRKNQRKEKVSLESFKVLKEIGSGSFGKVYKAIKKENGKVYALKVLDKGSLIMKNQLHCAITEANILKKVRHPYIIRLHYTFQTSQHLFLVMDYCPSGDLGSYMNKKGPFNENEAKLIIAELILAIEDLKPENILLGSDGHIRLTDFGLSKEGVKKTDVAKSFCGSPAYIAPEMLARHGIQRPADFYGVGAVLYELLTGNPVYTSESINIVFKQIARGDISIPEHISKDAKSLILKLLNKNPKKRPGTSNKIEIKRHIFFDGIDWEQVVQGKLPPVRPRICLEESQELLESTEPDFFKPNDNTKVQNKVRNFSFVQELED